MICIWLMLTHMLKGRSKHSHFHYSETFFGIGEVSKPVYMTYSRVKKTATVKGCHGWWKLMRTRASSYWHGVTFCLSQLNLNNLGPAALATESCSTQAVLSGKENLLNYIYLLILSADKTVTFGEWRCSYAKKVLYSKTQCSFDQFSIVNKMVTIL